MLVGHGMGKRGIRFGHPPAGVSTRLSMGCNSRSAYGLGILAVQAWMSVPLRAQETISAIASGNGPLGVMFFELDALEAFGWPPKEI